MDLLIENGVLRRVRTSEERITIPEGVVTISQGALSYRGGIKRIALPSTLKRIDDWGFASCRDLEELEIPDSVEYIGSSAFMGCGALRRIILPKGLEELKNDSFSYCRSLAEVKLPESLCLIGRCCFFHAENLCRIDLPDGLEEIGYQAFRATALSEIRIPGSLRSMGRGAFSNDPGIAIHLYDTIGYVPNDMCIIFATGVESVDRFTSHSVTVTDHLSGELLLSVPMFPDESDSWMKVLGRVWGDLSRFDMSKIDGAFRLIRSFETKRDVALYRLKTPIALSEEPRQTYLGFIRENEKKTVEHALKRDDPALLEFLDSLGAVSPENLDGYISYCTRAGSTTCCAYLMEKSRDASDEEDSLSLDGLW